MRAFIQSLCLFALVFGIAACAFLQGESKEKKIEVFMTSFQRALKQSDLEVLQLFETEQSRDAILSAINIMQNDDSVFVKSSVAFDKLTIRLGEDWINEAAKTEVTLATIPTLVYSISNPDSAARACDIIFWLIEKDNAIKIFSLEANNFYNNFIELKNEIQYAKHKEEELKRRAKIYEVSETLRQKYDSVVWYASYDDQAYFYVITGTWDESYLYPQSSKVKPDYKMGLVNEDGKVIVPVECELIGTLGFELEDAVEVKGPNGYGYFSLSGDTLLPPEYDHVIPYREMKGWIVQTSGQLGWVGDNGNYSQGFPTKQVEEFVRNYEFMPDQVTIAGDTYPLCEAPREEAAGSGAFIVPSYWIALGLSVPVRFDLTTTHTDAPIGGYTEYIEVSQSVFERFSNQVSLLVVHFKERFLEGREEFYERNRVVFTDNSMATLIVDDQVYGEELRLKKIGNNVIELSSTLRNTDMMYGFETVYKMYWYFELGEEGVVSKLSSNRTNPETEFAFMDSTYLEGTFVDYTEESDSPTPYYFRDVETLKKMRGEILGAYDLTNDDLKQYTKEDLPQVTDIDLHNLNFLARMIEMSRPPEGDV